MTKVMIKVNSSENRILFETFIVVYIQIYIECLLYKIKKLQARSLF